LTSPPNDTDDQGGEIYPRFRELPKRIQAVNIGAILDERIHAEVLAEVRSDLEALGNLLS